MRIQSLFFLCAACFLASGAAAQSPENCDERPAVPDKLISDLTAWIAMHTMYDVSELHHAPPEISFCSVGDWIDYEEGGLRVEPELRAAYDHPSNTVHLVLPWSADNPYDRSVLLHELVHDVQLANREWPCVGAPELEAYMLQAEYLGAYGIDPGFDWRSIFLLSLCP